MEHELQNVSDVSDVFNLLKALFPELKAFWMNGIHLPASMLLSDRQRSRTLIFTADGDLLGKIDNPEVEDLAAFVRYVEDKQLLRNVATPFIPSLQSDWRGAAGVYADWLEQQGEARQCNAWRSCRDTDWQLEEDGTIYGTRYFWKMAGLMKAGVSRFNPDYGFGSPAEAAAWLARQYCLTRSAEAVPPAR